jgi:hypothetical protein
MTSSSCTRVSTIDESLTIRAEGDLEKNSWNTDLENQERGETENGSENGDWPEMSMGQCGDKISSCDITLSVSAYGTISSMGSNELSTEDSSG